jgi:hypothetical protein
VLVQLLAEQQAQCHAVQQLQQHCSKLDERESASLQQLKVLTEQLAEAREGLTGQQQQLLSAVDLQGRTHARLMQLTAEHDQVRLRRGTRPALALTRRCPAVDRGPCQGVAGAAGTGSCLCGGRQ